MLYTPTSASGNVGKDLPEGDDALELALDDDRELVADETGVCLRRVLEWSGCGALPWPKSGFGCCPLAMSCLPPLVSNRFMPKRTAFAPATLSLHALLSSGNGSGDRSYWGEG